MSFFVRNDSTAKHLNSKVLMKINLLYLLVFFKEGIEKSHRADCVIREVDYFDRAVSNNPNQKQRALTGEERINFGL